ncbi:hypothetical protein Kfla_4666 [Kribbella flavida DSM 17836]|uniref:Uncharacterized protein n=1 Tax=Kribbella flavida (strain DSM 17836 / JCM 10339 / NBRC 14399) TaxID=479435 RepID=D2PZ75_KRIFD|nr:hypothetical protein [Kribbella flavida]ADB33684.1 hypothetical protein Kfla_4666 [Kribbella flavida DSM 17836]
MTVKLNQRAFEHAKHLVKQGQTKRDERDDWSEHAPTADQENDYLDKHGWDDYGRWYLGIDTEKSEETKGRHKFPYGDFRRLHRCGVISAESRAAQQDYDDITKAVAELHKLLDGDHA